MFCQRIASFKIRLEAEGKSDKAFACKDHVADMLMDALIYLPPSREVSVAIHPLANEEPCEHVEE